jgi:hypothetical protein
VRDPALQTSWIGFGGNLKDWGGIEGRKRESERQKSKKLRIRTPSARWRQVVEETGVLRLAEVALRAVKEESSLFLTAGKLAEG